MPLIAIAVFIVLVLSQGHMPPFDRVLGPGYTLVATHGLYGIIIDDRFAPRFLEPQDAGAVVAYWTPATGDIAQAETLLEPLRPGDGIERDLRTSISSPEDLVSRTWYGATIDGQRLLFVDGYCSGGIPGHPLVPFRVEDGGACYWHATIDAETWEVLSYIENGEA